MYNSKIRIYREHLEYRIDEQIGNRPYPFMGLMVLLEVDCR